MTTPRVMVRTQKGGIGQGSQAGDTMKAAGWVDTLANT